MSGKENKKVTNSEFDVSGNSDQFSQFATTEQVEKRFLELSESIKRFKEDIKSVTFKMEKESQVVKVSFMTIFGIFASFISFLTIKFQFLKTMNDPLKILGFIFILLMAILSFNLIMYYMFSDKKIKWFIVCFIFLFFMAGLFLICFAYPTNHYFIKVFNS